MKNTNNSAVKNVLTKFNNYVLMVREEDALQTPDWMHTLTQKIQFPSSHEKNLGQIYASLRKGMIQEYGAKIGHNY